jgi:cellulose synthase/poly-beta-1,6-N-acetylglucosamine synthase-like glycosyltransferase
MKISVLVPTYRRPDDLKRCLNALKHQTFSPFEVLLVVRDIDRETRAMLAAYPPEMLTLKIIDVTRSGQVAALNAGCAGATGEIIAITDDDAVPHTDWLERIHQHFCADDMIAGVGGRDWMYVNGELQTAVTEPGASSTVGQLQWFGRRIGNHHIGEGSARPVDILKGANMSYRVAAIVGIQFNEQLKGTGAQVDNEVDFCLKLKSRGWQLIYDPQVAVDHFPAPRFDEDQRATFNKTAQYNTSHNETYTILNNVSFLRKLYFLIWALAIGTRRTPGLVQIIRFIPTQGLLSIHRGLVSIQGRLAGIKTWLTAENAS